MRVLPATQTVDKTSFCILYFGVIGLIGLMGRIGLENPTILSYASYRSYRSYAKTAYTIQNIGYTTIQLLIFYSACKSISY